MLRVDDLQAVLFDLGDTLVHFQTVRPREFLEAGTRPAHQRLLELGFRPPSYRAYLRAVQWRFLRELVWSRIMRREARLIEAFHRLHHRLGMKVDAPQMEELVSCCVAPFRKMFSVDGEAHRVITRLEKSGFRLGLVSNTFFPGIAIDDVLRREGLLERFPVRVYSSDVGYMKPDPRIFQAALQRLGVEAERTLFIGDRLDKDVKGPARLGMKTMLLVRSGTMPRGRVRPDYVVRGLSEIPEALGAEPTADRRSSVA